MSSFYSILEFIYILESHHYVFIKLCIYSIVFLLFLFVVLLLIFSLQKPTEGKDRLEWKIIYMPYKEYLRHFLIIQVVSIIIFHAARFM